MDIQIQKGDITKVQADAIVNPANSFGWMGGGSAKAIKNAGGREIEDEVIAKSPLEIGKPVSTKVGNLNYKAIIHSPTVESPNDKALPYNVAMATRGALELADDMKFSVIAMPGMGTGIGGFPKKNAAKVMIEEIKKFEPINLEKVILVDIDDELVEFWQKELK
ncbi:MAG TPA: macro domain-containing protein [Candidatus Uhrbacteria bacterium]|nr:macro domain-containing protein [Candidatus Uhrbacteria bacterium]